MWTDKATEFNGDDQAYLAWLDKNPRGFVLNTPRSKPVNNMVLHRANCKTISTRKVRPGGFTERDYIKICAEDVECLRRWVRRHGRADGSFSIECSLCNPT